ncbi:hypothetical protein ABIF93_003768 [Bradyrhizobium japonicum]
METVVARPLRIERGRHCACVEIVSGQTGQLAGHFPGLARLGHVERVGDAVRFRRFDLAAIDVLDRKTGIDEISAAGIAGARVDVDCDGRCHDRGRRDSCVLREHEAVHVDDRAGQRSAGRTGGTGKLVSDDLRNLVVRFQLRPIGVREGDLDP